MIYESKKRWKVYAKGISSCILIFQVDTKRESRWTRQGYMRQRNGVSVRGYIIRLNMIRLVLLEKTSNPGLLGGTHGIAGCTVHLVLSAAEADSGTREEQEYQRHEGHPKR